MEEKYLSEIVDVNDIEKGKLNLITAPCGCGKTTFATDVLAKFGNQLHMCENTLYLIDTKTGKDQLLHTGILTENPWTGDEYWEIPGIMRVMTYAAYATIVEAAPKHDYWDSGCMIICDELHNAVKWSKWQDNDIHKRAIDIIKDRIRTTECTVVALSATPDAIKDEFGYCLKKIPLSGTPKCYKENSCDIYKSLKLLLTQIEKGKRGIIYLPHIREILKYQAYMDSRGFKTAALWSINNEEHPLSEKQLEVRNYIIEWRKMPKSIDILFINKSCETSISIGTSSTQDSPIDFMIIHSADYDTYTQVRGRYRCDLDKLYVYSPYICYDDIVIPENWLNRKLRKADIEDLIEYLEIKTDNRVLVKVPTFLREVERSGYKVTQKTIHGIRYKIIEKNNGCINDSIPYKECS